MTTLHDAARQALEALTAHADLHGTMYLKMDAITALRAALAQEQPTTPGCEHCNHPLYAATKCRVCGRVTEQAEPAYKTYPIRMHFEWVDGCWLFDGNPIDSGEWCVTLGDGGWMIYPKVEQAEPALEPVGWLESPHGAFRADPLYKMQFPSQLLHWQIPLYPAPPQRKPLSDEEIDAMWRKAVSAEGFTTAQFVRNFARAIERAVWEKRHD